MCTSLQEMAEEGEAVHYRHLQVGQNRIHVLLLEHLERAGAVFRRSDCEDAGAVQRPGDGRANELVVFDEQQGGCGQGCASEVPADAAWRGWLRRSAVHEHTGGDGLQARLRSIAPTGRERPEAPDYVVLPAPPHDPPNEPVP